MGQNTTKANERHNNEEVKKDREQLLQEFNSQREQFIEALQSIASSAILPNGPFPAEIIDMILRHFRDSFAQFQIASCCKLWLSVFLPKSINWLVQRRFAPSNIANGLFWPSVLLRQCWEGRDFLIGCDWSTHNESMILNNWFFSEYEAWTGGGVLFAAASHRLDPSTNKLTNEEQFGAYYINNTKVVPIYMWNPNVLHVSWESVTCYKPDGSSFEIKYDRIEGHGNRIITGLANMDGSDQLMLFDRCYNSYDKEVEHKIEVFDLNTGERLYSFIHSCFFIVGLWKNCVVSYGPYSILSFRDLKTGFYTKHWQFFISPHCQIKLNQFLFIRNNTMAMCETSNVRIYDLNNGPMLKKINILESNSFKIRKKERAEVVSVAFDDWKLVTVTHIYRWYDGLNYNSMIVSDVWISIFDVTKDYRHMNTIRTTHTCINTWPVEILLPSNGKILINAKHSELTEIDFFHPNLMKNTIKILQCHKNDSKATVQTLSPLNLSEYIVKGLNAELGNITYTTYFARDPTKPFAKQLEIKRNSSITDFNSCIDNIFDLDRPQQKRLTFIYPVNKSSMTQLRTSKFNWMRYEEFERHWEIRPDHFSCLQLATLDLSKCHQSHYPRFLPEHMTGDILFILFEEFDPLTNQWLIRDPFVPEGTSLEL